VVSQGHDWTPIYSIPERLSGIAPATGPLQNLVSPSFANPLVLLIVSMVIGALFGYASDQFAKGTAQKTAHPGVRITGARRPP
jgi:hypothetical protein